MTIEKVKQVIRDHLNSAALLELKDPEAWLDLLVNDLKPYLRLENDLVWDDYWGSWVGIKVPTHEGFDDSTLNHYIDLEDEND